MHQTRLFFRLCSNYAAVGEILVRNPQPACLIYTQCIDVIETPIFKTTDGCENRAEQPPQIVPSTGEALETTLRVQFVVSSRVCSQRTRLEYKRPRKGKQEQKRRTFMKCGTGACREQARLNTSLPDKKFGLNQNCIALYPSWLPVLSQSMRLCISRLVRQKFEDESPSILTPSPTSFEKKDCR